MAQTQLEVRSPKFTEVSNSQLLMRVGSPNGEIVRK